MRLKAASLAVLASLALPVLASAAARIPLRTVSVTGTGSVLVRPNVARVSLSYTRVVPAGASIQQAIQDNDARVAPALEHIRAVAGPRASVAVIPSIQPNQEWNEERRRQEVTGQTVMTSVEVTLRGESSVEQNLGKLFDSAALREPEAINVTEIGVSERRQAAAKREAYGKAIADARNEASAQLLPGEKLGAAISRGNGAQPYSPRGGARAMMAMESAGGGGASQEVQLGKVQVTAQTSVVFAVGGRARK